MNRKHLPIFLLINYGAEITHGEQSRKLFPNMFHFEKKIEDLQIKKLGQNAVSNS